MSIRKIYATIGVALGAILASNTACLEDGAPRNPIVKDSTEHYNLSGVGTYEDLRRDAEAGRIIPEDI